MSEQIGLYDVDSVLPNLALMKLARFHRDCGDTVEMYDPNFPLMRSKYARVYASKVFSFSRAEFDDDMIIGGAGVDVSSRLPAEVEVLTDTRSENGVAQKREMNYVTESGLYTLILRSRKAVTPGTVQHRFRRWITMDVLPSLRTKGRYELPGREQDSFESLGTVQEVANKARLVEIALKMKGRAAACALWDELGLPHLVDGSAGEGIAPGAVDRALPVLRAYFDARLSIVKGKVIPARDLYADYAAWAAEHEGEIISETAFGRGMARLAPEFGYFKAKMRSVVYCDLAFVGGEHD